MTRLVNDLCLGPRGENGVHGACPGAVRAFIDPEGPNDYVCECGCHELQRQRRLHDIIGERLSGFPDDWYKRLNERDLSQLRVLLDRRELRSLGHNEASP